MFTSIKLIRNVKNNVRSSHFDKLQTKIQNMFQGKESVPPYDHVCQIGDPVLRAKAAPVDVATIQTPEFQKILTCLVNVLRTNGASGLAAPQIGVPLKVFVVEITESSVAALDPEVRKSRETEPYPLTFFINPTLKIQDYTMIRFPEVCASVLGFKADVPRARVIEITAIDQFGQSFSQTVKGWPARVIQHEYDHLEGEFFIDKMDSKTFHCLLWPQVNRYKGKISMPFHPKATYQK